MQGLSSLAQERGMMDLSNLIVDGTISIDQTKKEQGWLYNPDIFISGEIQTKLDKEVKLQMVKDIFSDFRKNKPNYEIKEISFVDLRFIGFNEVGMAHYKQLMVIKYKEKVGQ